MTAPRIRVGLLFGGRSGEHEISCVSARHVAAAFDPVRYQVVPIAITREGRWLLPDVSRRVLEGGPLALPETALEVGGIPVTVDAVGLDVVFPVLHGPFGEDGTVQGLLEMAGIPYVGSGVLGSAVGMDKDVMKRLFRDAGLPIADFEVVREAEWARSREAVVARAARLGLPCFVKPANLGSSVGVSRAVAAGDLPGAIDEALRHDTKALVEEAVPGREIEVAVLGNEDPEAAVPGEVIAGADFYSYEAKYVDGTARTEVPARLPPAVAEAVQALAVRAFRAVEASGMARVDFFYVESAARERRLILNEINTIPGFTVISMFPKMWEASGLRYPRLIDRLIELAFERHAQRTRVHPGA
ncbi:MAG TPA: D-alanine--D-alanine ligase family protein [Actinomycetota bacterium]|nr:D-alanine--D-alanine ligase family protein [Actinomycetota bacterium]